VGFIAPWRFESSLRHPKTISTVAGGDCNPVATISLSLAVDVPPNYLLPVIQQRYVQGLPRIGPESPFAPERCAASFIHARSDELNQGRLSMLAIWTKATTWMKEEKGASMVEYALLIVLIAIVALVAITLAGDAVSETFSEVGSALD
jgi:pilus assembly protein Flp/PilA